MANYYLNVEPISRKQGRSITSSANYITGQALRDGYTGKAYYRHRDP